MENETKTENKITVEVIVIDWEKIDFNTAENQHWKESDAGLYQVYGNHNSYGKDSLLYIGLTQNTFSGRLLNDDRLLGSFLETTVEPKSIRLGRIVKRNKYKETKAPEETPENWRRYIEVAEEILIATHVPALNSKLGYKLSDLEKYNKEDDDKDKKHHHYLIINWGDRGCLLPEVSTIRNSYRFYDYETPFGFEPQK